MDVLAIKMKTGKHVIFLGAGASSGSGYPLANNLRLLLSSRLKWEEALAGYDIKHRYSGRLIADLGMPYWDKYSGALDLFRNGAFATVDEFVKLAGGFRFQEEINGLRFLVRAALGLFNPEEHFEQSEYYGFVQSLFEPNLVDLRDDITVLTYNYDPYLEFLLSRALEHRWRMMRRGKGPVLSGEDMVEEAKRERQLNAVTSGFYSRNALRVVEDERAEPSFCVLKLHGSICFGVNEAVDYQTLFLKHPPERARTLFDSPVDGSAPPILFPWEIMTDKGFVKEEAFAAAHSRPLYQLFRRIWERARREIGLADKVSFVGLSMHQFLFQGLKYLFEGKGGDVEVVVANPDNSAFIPGRPDTYWAKQPHSSAFAVGEALNRAAPGMRRVGIPSGQTTHSAGDITIVKNFAEFVRTQMKPLALS